MAEEDIKFLVLEFHFDSKNCACVKTLAYELRDSAP